MGHPGVSLFEKHMGLKSDTINQIEEILKHYTDLACKEPNFTFMYRLYAECSEEGRCAVIYIYADVNGWRYKPSLRVYNKLGPEFLKIMLLYVDWLLKNHL
jgi:hypothetical protein